MFSKVVLPEPLLPKITKGCPIEIDKFELVKKANDFEEQKDICNDILEFNPINYKVRLYVLSKALERFGNQGHLDGQIQQVFEDHLERYIGKFIKENHKPLISLQSLIDSSKIRLPSHLPPMSAGLIGYLGYETIELYEKLPPRKRKKAEPFTPPS